MIQNKFRMLRTYLRNSEKNKIEIQSGVGRKSVRNISLNVTCLPHIIKNETEKKNRLYWI